MLRLIIVGTFMDLLEYYSKILLIAGGCSGSSADPEFFQKTVIAGLCRIRGGQQLGSVENGTCTCHKRPGLHLLRHFLPAGGQPYYRIRHNDPCRGNHTDEFKRIKIRRAFQRSALHLDQHIDRYAFRMRVDNGKLPEEAGTIIP